MPRFNRLSAWLAGIGVVCLGSLTNLGVAQAAAPNGPGSALIFDGQNDYLTAASPSVPVGTAAYTIEAWIKPNTMHVGAIASWGIQTNSRANVLALTPTGLVNYWWANDLSAPTPNLAGAWHHVAATFDGVTRRILLDGKVVARDIPSPHDSVSMSFAIGSAFAGQFFGGQMDELRIWDSGRTASQIASAMRRQVAGNAEHLVACYRFDEGAGLTAGDATGNPANTTTLANGPSWVTSGVAPFAPTVVTLPATDLVNSAARLTGSALPNLADGSAFFEWGLTTAYGIASTPVSLPAASGGLTWSSTLLNLGPGLTYHYRAVATNENGASFGSDHSFRVPMTLVVSTTNNSGPGSLREAIAAAMDGDEIRFGVQGTILLKDGELLIDRSIRIVGPGPDQLTISGDHANRVFRVAWGKVSLSALTVRDGATPALEPIARGGGLYNNTTLVVSNCIFVGNAAIGAVGRPGDSLSGNRGYLGGLAQGGAVYNSGNLMLISCLFLSNSVSGGIGGPGTGLIAPGGVGGNGAGGALANDGEVTLVNCTLSANSATGGTGGNNLSASPGGGNGGNGLGGGFINQSNCVLVHCTLVGNNAIRGSGGRGRTLLDRGSSGACSGGGFQSSPGVGAASRLLNTLMGLNGLSGSDPILGGPDVAGTVSSTGHNLISITNASTGWAGSDQLGSVPFPLSPGIGPLIDNFSNIPSHPLLQGSPAQDAGDDGVLGAPYYLAMDQRGLPRHSGRSVDIGAVEAQLQIEVVNANDSGMGSLRESLLRVSPGGAITFSPALIGQQITLTNGELAIDKDVTIQGFAFRKWSETVSIRGGGKTRLFQVNAGRVQLRSLVLTEGRAIGIRGLDGASDPNGSAGASAAGGAVLNLSELTVSNVVFVSNTAQGGRGGNGSQTTAKGSGSGGIGGDGFGGAICNSNVLTLIDCAFWLNAARGGDGGWGGAGIAAGENGGSAGAASGGALYSAGRCSIERTLFFRSIAQGGVGGLGGAGKIGIEGGVGGRGGRGGDAEGGGVFSLDVTDLINCTFGENRAVGGTAGHGAIGSSQGAGGDGGDARGAGFRNKSASALIHCTIVENLALGGDRGESVTAPGSKGAESGAGVFTEITHPLRLWNTLLSRNVSSTQLDDIAGKVASLGHNFVGFVGASAGWLPADLLGASPIHLDDGLAPFDGTSYPLIEESPSVDAGDDAALGPPGNVTMDAHGALRPSGNHVDIGAFELARVSGTTFTVVNLLDSGPGSLRERLAAAPIGGTIRFAPNVTGTIVLSSGELVLEKSVSLLGPGPEHLVISGNNNSRVLRITAGKNLIGGLTLRDGLAAPTDLGANGRGGCVLNQASLVISNCALLNNTARGGGGTTGPFGTAQSGGIGGDAEGGAIYNTGDITLVSSLVADNRAESGAGGSGGSGGGSGGSGGNAGRARGGGIWNSRTLEILNSSILRNRAQGAGGGEGGAGATFGGLGALGGWAEGGGVYTAGLLSVFNSTLSQNAARGGSGGRGGSGSLNSGSGFGGIGGGAQAGAVYSAGEQTAFVHATVASNSVAGGLGGAKPGGTPSSNGTGQGGGVSSSSDLFLNTLVAHNSASFSPDVVGPVRSLGFNIVTSSDGEQSWTPSDRITSPLLGELALNFGPTPTHALLPGSPALDAGADANVVLAASKALVTVGVHPLITDQRGGLRVVDLSSASNAAGSNGSDIGAIEMGGVPPRIIGISVVPVRISYTSDSGIPYLLEREDAMAPAGWMPVPGSARVGNGGVVESIDSSTPAAARFYRATTR